MMSFDYNEEWDSCRQVSQAKVILLGNCGVGKSCLLDRYTHGKFNDRTPATLWAVFGSKSEKVGGRTIQLQIWDTAGTERYRSSTNMYYRNAKAAIICYSMTDRQSWEDVPGWIAELYKKHDCKIYLAGTKSDLFQEPTSQPEVIAQDEVLNFIKQCSPAVVERSFQTSSKTGQNIDLLFREIASDIATCIQQEERDTFDTSIRLTKTSHNHDKKCTC